MRWYHYLLAYQTILLSAVFALMFGWSSYSLLTDHSGMNGYMHSFYNMSYSKYLAIQVTTTVAFLLLLFFSIWALKKKRELFVLISAALFFFLFIGIVLYSIYYT